MKQTTQLQIENSTHLETQKSLKKKIGKLEDHQGKLEKFYLKMKSKKYRNAGTQADLNEEYKRKVLQQVLNSSDFKSENEKPQVWDDASLGNCDDDINSFYINQSAMRETSRTMLRDESGSIVSTKNVETEPNLPTKSLR